MASHRPLDHGPPDGPREDDLDAARSLFAGTDALAEALRGIKEETGRAAEAYRAVVRSLALALGARDGYTGDHSVTVHELAIAVARALGLDGQAVAEVEAVALLHDVGKIGVPDHVLHKAGPLDDDEWELMRQHPLIGERILRPLPGLAGVATAVRHEHEHWDGSGYPDGIAGDRIPPASRIVLACDAFHALVSDRPYRAALPLQAATEELRRCAGAQFDPAVVEALLSCLDEHGNVLADGEEVDFTELLSAGDDDANRLEREVHALLSVASAVATVEQLDDLVEIAAEEARRGVGAASLSISRWEADARVLRVIVNVGELADWEERRPPDETYRLDDDDAMRRLLVEGAPYATSLDDPDAFTVERDLLVSIGKHSCVAVPIMLGGTPWGEIWAARDHDRPVFNEHDIRFLQTLSGQIAAAVGRTELYARMADLAFRDPLTGVGNRRALEERLDLAVREAGAEGRDLTVLLCDLDNLKELNDAHGHAAGDEALRAVAGALVAEAGHRDGGLVYRLGGDEFCLVLDGAHADEGLTVGERTLARLAGAPPPHVSASFGIASLGLGQRRSPDLLRAADAALYVAKRSGRNRVCLADPSSASTWEVARPDSGGRRRHRDRRAADVSALLTACLGALDGELGYGDVLTRIQGVVAHVCGAVNAARGAISFCRHGTDAIATAWTVNFRSGRTWTASADDPGDDYGLDDFPQTARLIRSGGSFVTWVTDPAGDRAEQRLLAEFGLQGVLAAAAADSDAAWLLEVYADGETLSLGSVEPAARLLMAEAVAPGRGHRAVRSAAA